MPRFGRCGPSLKAPHPRKSSRGLLRKRRRAGSIPAVKRGLKNAGEYAIPSASASKASFQGELLSTPLYRLPMSARCYTQIYCRSTNLGMPCGGGVLS